MKRVTILFLTGLVFTAFFAPRYAEAQAPAQVPADTGVFRQEGIASWYGNQFNGRPTASGEIFNSNLYTAAHPSLPFGTLLLVTNAYNGRQVVVRVNDRGPFVAGRIIDLSRAAAERLDMIGSGTALVVAEYTNMPIGYYGQTSLPQSTPISPQSVPPAPQSTMADSSSSGPVLLPEIPPIPPRPPATQSVPPAPLPAQLSQSVSAPQSVPSAPQSVPPAPQSVPPAPQSVPPASQSIPPAPQPVPPATQPIIQYVYVPMPEPAPAPVTQYVYTPTEDPKSDLVPPPPEVIRIPVVPEYPPSETPKAEPPNQSSTAAVIKPSIPPADDGKIYRIQAGSFKVARNALEAFDKLKAAGLNPAYEKNGDMYRVVLAGVPSADVSMTAEKMGAAGFREALIREE